jgi:hypothetical protein
MVLTEIRDASIWDAFIEQSSDGLLFHTWEYLQITAKHTGFTLLPYGVWKGEQLISVIPFFYRNMNGFRTLFSPPPMTVIPYLGIVLSSDYAGYKQSKKETLLKLIADGIREAVADLSPNYTSINCVPDFLDIRQFSWDAYATKMHYTYQIDLTRPREQLWSDLHMKLRGKIKKMLNAGLTLEKTTDISRFYDLLSERYADPALAIPMLPKSYLSDLFRAFPDHLSVYFISDPAGEIVSVVTAQEYKRFLLWMGMPKIETPYAGNEYLQWILMERAKSEGYSVFENMGANNSDLVFFKAKFNPRLVPYLEIYRKDRLGSLAETAYLQIGKRLMLAMGRR